MSGNLRRPRLVQVPVTYPWTSELSDHDLAARCQSGDVVLAESAFLELYDRYQARVFNTAFRVMGNAADAADVVQDVFLIIYRKIAAFQSESRLFTWIYRITVNLSIDRKRRRGSAGLPILADSGADGVLSTVADSNTQTPEEAADQQFVGERVQRSIDRLSPKLRAIVVLRYIEDLSYGDIAEILDCSVGTVKSRLNRAHRSLQELLRPTVEAMLGEGGTAA